MLGGHTLYLTLFLIDLDDDSIKDVFLKLIPKYLFLLHGIYFMTAYSKVYIFGSPSLGEKGSYDFTTVSMSVCQ